MAESKLIVGLGNPGKEYEATRHNLGFLAVQQLAARLGLKFKKSSFTQGFIAQTGKDGRCVLLLLPTTFMNNAGVAVKGAVQKKGILPENVLVVCDDFHLDFQQVRIRSKGSDGGHNGLSDVIQKLGTDAFPRLRLGIGAPRHSENVAEYVLGAFSREERRSLEEFTQKAVDCCCVWLEQGITEAMQRFNQYKQ